MDGVYCILPVRGLDNGKSRLGAVLDASRRARLNGRLYERTLDILEEFPGAAATMVVSGSAVVRDRARLRGMAALADPPGGGLNESVGAAIAAVRARGARGVFVVPVDLPLLDAASLCDLVAGTPSPPVCVLVPDRHGSGTNFHYQSPIRLAACSYGEGSFARHRDMAAAAGLRVVVRHAANVAFDLDLPADYALWRCLEDGGARRLPQRSDPLETPAE